MPTQEQEQEQEQEQYYEQQTVPFDAQAGVDWLCEQLSVSGKSMRQSLAEVIELERRNGTMEVQDIAESMLRTRRNYEATIKSGFIWPVKAFFEQGIWKRPNEWKGKSNGQSTIERHQRDLQDIATRAAGGGAGEETANPAKPVPD